MKRFLFFLALILISESCTSFRVVHDQTYEKANLNAFKTFGFVASDGMSLLSSVRTETIEGIKSAIVREMTQRGYKLADRPDLLINVGLSVQEKVQTRETTIREAPPVYMGQRNYSWSSQEVEAGRYNEGTLTVEVIEVQRNTLAWDGAVAGAVSNKVPKQAKLDRAVGTLFSKFPGKAS